jgi:tRNA threonylcarbamoyladenosine biosynthesis protein TsaB
MTTILALDTSTDHCSVAIWREGLLASRDEHLPRQHTRQLLPMVDEVLREASMSLRDVDAIAFGAGPGSFTGLRICLGFAQGLAYSVDVPLIPVSTLCAVALAASEQFSESDITVLQDARMNELYVGHYRGNTAAQISPVIQDRLLKPNDISVDASSLVVGDGLDLLSDEQQEALKPRYLGSVAPSARYIAALALPLFESGATVPAHLAEPVYLRNEVSWQKRVKKSDAINP